MAQISSDHVQPLTMGFVGLVVFALVGIGIVNCIANR
jgi:hypothetical protein